MIATPKRSVRSAFVSDVHLGSRYCNAEGFLRFLQTHEFEQLYLVGDIIDGWRLYRRWWWPPIYDQILNHLWELTDQGVKVCYTPGNHDEFFRRLPFNYRFMEVENQFTHEGADGRRYLVTHGDLYDTIELRAPWLSMLGAAAYDSLMWLNHRANRWRSTLRLPPRCYTSVVKQRVKQAVAFVSNFQQQLTEHAQRLDCDGVICGHIHTPALDQGATTLYGNTGDWVEHGSAILELHDGSLQLIELNPATGLMEPQLHSPQRSWAHGLKGRPRNRTSEIVAGIKGAW